MVCLSGFRPPKCSKTFASHFSPAIAAIQPLSPCSLNCSQEVGQRSSVGRDPVVRVHERRGRRRSTNFRGSIARLSARCPRITVLVARHRARLVSGCRSGSSGWAFYPQRSYKRFPTHVMLVFLLQAFLAQPWTSWIIPSFAKS
jgi:hypothetical protein